jgi:hypothetical protein
MKRRQMMQAARHSLPWPVKLRRALASLVLKSQPSWLLRLRVRQLTLRASRMPTTFPDQRSRRNKVVAKAWRLQETLKMRLMLSK